MVRYLSSHFFTEGSTVCIITAGGAGEVTKWRIYRSGCDIVSAKVIRWCHRPAAGRGSWREVLLAGNCGARVTGEDVTNVTRHVNTPQTTHWLSHSRTEPQVELSPNSIHESIRRGSDWVRWIGSGDSSVGTAGCWLWDWWCSGQVWQDMSCGALGEGDGSLLIFHPNLSFPMLHIVTGGVIAYEISGIIKQPPFVIDTFSGVQRQVICQLMVTKTPTA